MAGRSASFSMARDTARRTRRIEFFLTLMEAAACVALVWVFLVALFFGPDNAQAAPLDVRPGMTCTLTKQSDPGRDRPRTYGVEVVGHFDAATDKDGKAWLWVKRPEQARYMSIVVEASDLSGCK